MKLAWILTLPLLGLFDAEKTSASPSSSVYYKNHKDGWPIDMGSGYRADKDREKWEQRHRWNKTQIDEDIFWPWTPKRSTPTTTTTTRKKTTTTPAAMDARQAMVTIVVPILIVLGAIFVGYLAVRCSKKSEERRTMLESQPYEGFDNEAESGNNKVAFINMITGEDGKKSKNEYVVFGDKAAKQDAQAATSNAGAVQDV